MRKYDCAKERYSETMSNDKAQTPTRGSDENDKKKSKTKNDNKKNEKNNNDKGNNNRNNRYGVKSRISSSFNTSSRNFEGEESSIRVVLGLCFENKL